MPKISVTQNIHSDTTNAYTVTIYDERYGVSLEYAVHTSDSGEGLWIDGHQTLGLCQFNAGHNPREAIRRYFAHYYAMPD